MEALLNMYENANTNRKSTKKRRLENSSNAIISIINFASKEVQTGSCDVDPNEVSILFGSNVQPFTQYYQFLFGIFWSAYFWYYNHLQTTIINNRRINSSSGIQSRWYGKNLSHRNGHRTDESLVDWTSPEHFGNLRSSFFILLVNNRITNAWSSSYSKTITILLCLLQLLKLVVLLLTLLHFWIL